MSNAASARHAPEVGFGKRKGNHFDVYSMRDNVRIGRVDASVQQLVGSLTPAAVWNYDKELRSHIPMPKTPVLTFGSQTAMRLGAKRCMAVVAEQAHPHGVQVVDPSRLSPPTPSDGVVPYDHKALRDAWLHYTLQKNPTPDVVDEISKGLPEGLDFDDAAQLAHVQGDSTELVTQIGVEGTARMGLEMALTERPSRDPR